MVVMPPEREEKGPKQGQEMRTARPHEPSASEASSIAEGRIYASDRQQPEREEKGPKQGQIKKTLITGAGGFIGRHVCAVLEEGGCAVRRVVRRLEHPDSVQVKDIGPHTDWSEMVRGMDAVVHLAARVHVLREQADEPRERFREVNVDATRRLAEQAAAAGVLRFVFISTIGVHGVRTQGQGFRETDVPNPLNDYALSKLQAEEALRQVSRDTGMEVVVIRPPLVYGPGVKANFLLLLRVVHSGVPLPLASIRNRRDMIYVGNLSDAIARCLSHPGAAGQTFVLSDGQAVSTPELIRKLAQAMGRTPLLIPCPAAVLRASGRLLQRSEMVHRLVSSLEVDSAHIRETLDWKPPYTFDEALAATAAWYLSEQS